MKEATPLSLQGGFEQIVNAHADMLQEKRENKCTDRKKRKYDKMLHRMEACLAGEALAVVFAFAGLLAPWVASIATTLLLAAVCIYAGRLSTTQKN